MLSFRLFGTPELRNGKESDLHSLLAHSKHAALLAYLAVGQPRLHRRDRLTALFWPDLDDVRARNALSKALHRIRRILGDDVFIVQGNETIGTNCDELWCDVRAFEAAAAAGRHAEAVELYRRGELLEGFILADVGDFERWLESERSRLRQRALQSANALADDAERAGDVAGAAEWARVACSVAPYDETALRRRLTALDRLGDRAGALSNYKTFAARIAQDLEAEPAPETRALVRSLREKSGPAIERAVAREVKVERLPTPSAEEVPEPSAAPERGAVTTSVSAAAPAEPPAEDVIRPRSPRRPADRIVIAAAAIAILLLTATVIRQRRTHEQPGLIAVGQLRNRTGETALNPLAEMATGTIIQQLAQSGNVKTLDLRGLNDTPAQDLGAGKIVRGDMYGRGDSLLVQMQIVDSKDGRVLHQFDPVVVPRTNAYVILDRLRDGVGGAVAALTDTLYLPWSTAHSRPPNFAAFQEFMQGLDALVHQTPQVAVDHLQRAVTLDTGFVEAKIWLLEQADVLGKTTLVDSIRRAAMAQRSRLGAFDQVSLDRELAFLAGRWEDAYSASRRLVAIAPTTPDAQVYLAQAAMATRRYPEAVAVLHRMDRTKGWLKDLAQLTQWDLQAHRLMGDDAGAVKEWREAFKRAPDDYGICNSGVLTLASAGQEREVDALISQCASLQGAPQTTDRAYEVAGRGYRSRGRAAAARRAFERALGVRTAMAKDDPRRRRGVGSLQCELGQWRAAYETLRASADTSSLDDRTVLAVAAAHVGDSATVNATLRWMDEWRSREVPRGQDKMDRAFIAVARGERAEAIRLLRQSIEEGAAPAWSAWYVRFELQPLRGDPRFEELIRSQT